MCFESTDITYFWFEFFSINTILLNEENIYKASISFKWLMLGFIGICINFIFGTLLTANGNLKQLNILAISGMILNIVLNIVLIPTHKALGSAIASLITQFVVLFAQIFLVKIIFNLKNEKL